MTEDKLQKKLVAKAIHGNADAYGELIESYKEYLYRTAMLSVKNQENALDIVGECIIRGFQCIHSLKNPAYFKTWLTRILMNTVMDYYRSEKYSRNLDEIQVAAPDNVVSSEEKLDLYRAIDMLSEKYRTVIILKYFDELKISEIAYVMEIPEGSVKAYLSRARAELKHLLMEENIYEDRISEYTSTGEAQSGSSRQYGKDICRTEEPAVKIVGC